MSDSPSSLNVQDLGELAIVGFRDNSILDVLTIQRIGRELYDLVEQARKSALVLDFSNVRFLSSQALGVLVQLRRKAEQARCQVVLSQLKPELARVFKITNLDKMFEFFDSNEKALARLGYDAGPPRHNSK